MLGGRAVGVPPDVESRSFANLASWSKIVPNEHRRLILDKHLESHNNNKSGYKNGICTHKSRGQFSLHNLYYTHFTKPEQKKKGGKQKGFPYLTRRNEKNREIKLIISGGRDMNN